jgi:hypothetical protein
MTDTTTKQQAIIDEATASGIPVVHIDMTGVREITLGGNGEILSITKDGNPPVTVPPVDSTIRN